MRNNNTRGALFTLAILAGIYVFRNRFVLERGTWRGVGRPMRSRNLLDSARNIANRFRGRMERGATIGESIVDRVAS